MGIEKGGKSTFPKSLTEYSVSVLNKDIIHPLLKKKVHPTLILITVGNTVYNESNEVFTMHMVASHSGKFEADVGTNSKAIEDAWKHLRKVFRDTRVPVSFYHLDGYISEYAYQCIRKDKNSWELIDDFIPTVILKKITKKGHG